MSKVPRQQIANRLAQRSLKSGVSKKFGREVAAYLLSEGRTAELEPLLRDIQADWAEQGYVEVIAVSAHPLTATIKAEIKAKIREIYPKAKQIVVTEQYDPAIVGGVKIELANQQLDLSIEAKLNKLKQLTTGE